MMNISSSENFIHVINWWFHVKTHLSGQERLDVWTTCHMSVEHTGIERCCFVVACHLKLNDDDIFLMWMPLTLLWTAGIFFFLGNSFWWRGTESTYTVTMENSSLRQSGRPWRWISSTPKQSLSPTIPSPCGTDPINEVSPNEYVLTYHIILMWNIFL